MAGMAESMPLSRGQSAPLLDTQISFLGARFSSQNKRRIARAGKRRIRRKISLHTNENLAMIHSQTHQAQLMLEVSK